MESNMEMSFDVLLWCQVILLFGKKKNSANVGQIRNISKMTGEKETWNASNDRNKTAQIVSVMFG